MEVPTVATGLRYGHVRDTDLGWALLPCGWRGWHTITKACSCLVGSFAATISKLAKFHQSQIQRWTPAVSNQTGVFLVQIFDSRKKTLFFFHREWSRCWNDGYSISYCYIISLLLSVYLYIYIDPYKIHQNLMQNKTADDIWIHPVLVSFRRRARLWWGLSPGGHRSTVSSLDDAAGTSEQLGSGW